MAKAKLESCTDKIISIVSKVSVENWGFDLEGNAETLTFGVNLFDGRLTLCSDGTWNFSRA